MVDRVKRADLLKRAAGKREQANSRRGLARLLSLETPRHELEEQVKALEAEAAALESEAALPRRPGNRDRARKGKSPGQQ